MKRLLRSIMITALLLQPAALSAARVAFTNYDAFTNGFTFTNAECESIPGTLTIGWFEGFSSYSNGWLNVASVTNTDYDDRSNETWAYATGDIGSAQVTNGAFITNGILYLAKQNYYTTTLLSRRSFNADRVVSLKYYGRNVDFLPVGNTNSQTGGGRWYQYGSKIYFHYQDGDSEYQLVGRTALTPEGDGNSTDWGKVLAVPSATINDYNTATIAINGSTVSLDINGEGGSTWTYTHGEPLGVGLVSYRYDAGHNEPQPEGNDRYDHIRVIDTNKAYAVAKPVSNDTSILTFRFTAERVSASGYTYRYYARNGTNETWESVMPDTTHVFSTVGDSNLSFLIELENGNGVSANNPMVSNVYFYYNYLPVESHDVVTAFPVETNYTFDVTFTYPPDVTSTPSFYLYPSLSNSAWQTAPSNGTLLTSSEYSLSTNAGGKSNTIRVRIDLSAIDGLSAGYYDVGFSNFTALTNMIVQTELYMVKGGIPYYSGSKTLMQEEEDLFYPKHISASDENAETYLLVYAGETATAITVNLYNARGRLIRTLAENETHTGYITYRWDGKNAGGNRVRRGRYFVVIGKGTRSVVRSVYVVD